MKLAFYPAFKDAETLTDHFFRLHWYLAPFADVITEIVLPRAEEAIVPGVRPVYLSDELEKLVGGLPVRFETVGDDGAEAVSSADHLFLWSGDVAAPAGAKGSGAGATRIDHRTQRFAASYYLKFAEIFEERRTAALAASRDVFSRIAERCESEVGYIFGTGPGLASASDHDFSDGVSIACNSMVRNRTLLDRLRPPLIVIADPIFHAGCSTYAAEFRVALIDALDRYDADLIVPLRDHHIYTTYLPSRFADRIAAVPFVADDQPNLDLTARYEVTSTGNILTLFLLPLASTFFEEIRIFGCDGRPKAENAYFWSHDKASQFSERMDDIKLAHPAFFAIDYDDYYNEHCETLERWIAAAEKRGKFITNHTPSHIPALAARPAPKVTELRRSPPAQPYGAVASIDPDALGNFGHFLSYDCRIGDEVRHRGLSFSIIGREDFEFPACHEQVAKVFTVNTWKIGNATRPPPKNVFQTFARQLDQAVSALSTAAGDRRVMLYMYCGSLMHAHLADRVLRNYDNVDCCMNLFWTSFVDYGSALHSSLWGPETRRILERGRVSLTVPTHQLQRRLERLIGLRIPVAPHPSTTFDDSAARALSERSSVGFADAPTILFPGGMSESKGFDLTLAAAATLAAERPLHRCIVRAANSRAMHGEMRKEVARLADAGVEISSDDLDDEAFAAFLSNGDIIVLPYRAPDFSERTSGLLIDALLLGRPAVVLENTWLAEIIQRHGCGVVATADPAGIVAAIIEAIDRRDELVKAARQYARRYVQKHSWRRLVDTILEPPASALVVYPETDAETDIEAGADDIAEPVRAMRPLPRARHAHVDETRVVSLLLSDRTGPRSVMFDVGAHFGTSASYFHSLGWSIHCFEPDPSNRSKLQSRYEGEANIVIDPRAVSDQAATDAPFFQSEESTGISGLHAFRDSHREATRIDITTVAEIIADRNIERIDFLKIDVEGFDLSVLRGVPWDSMRPDVIECEFEDAKTIPLGHDWRDIAEYLSQRGYAVYVSEWHPIVRYGVRHDWRRVYPYGSAAPPADGWGNLLAFAEDPGYAAVTDAFERLLKCAPEKKAAGVAAQRRARLIADPALTSISRRIEKIEASFSMIDGRIGPAEPNHGGPDQGGH